MTFWYQREQSEMEQLRMVGNNSVRGGVTQAGEVDRSIESNETEGSVDA